MITDRWVVSEHEQIATPVVFSDDDKTVRRNKVLTVFGILCIIAFFLSWNGDIQTSGQAFGRYLGMVIIISAGYYFSFKPK